MTDRPWKQAERAVARMLGGARYWANSGAAVDVESDAVVCQVKHRARGSLAELEAWALAAAQQGAARGKLGVVAVKRRAGRGRPTSWLFVLAEAAWPELTRRTSDPGGVRVVPSTDAPPPGRRSSPWRSSARSTGDTGS